MDEAPVTIALTGVVAQAKPHPNPDVILAENPVRLPPFPIAVLKNKSAMYVAQQIGGFTVVLNSEIHLPFLIDFSPGYYLKYRKTQGNPIKSLLPTLSGMQRWRAIITNCQLYRVLANKVGRNCKSAVLSGAEHACLALFKGCLRGYKNP